MLQLHDLQVEFRTNHGEAKAINGVNLSVHQGEALGIVGESGSGKSVTARTVMGLLDAPGYVAGGRIEADGEDVLGMAPKQRRALYGQQISMVFQDALSALNPVHTVGHQIGELFRVHRGASRKAAKVKAIEMMDRVRIPDAARRVNDYPHQFSGGMRQRIVIAMALALDPQLLIADEPTTALDVTVQAQILELLREEQRSRDMGLMLITHDISVVREVTDSVAVMYAGNIVESGPTAEVLSNPQHPYTRGLIDSVDARVERGSRLPAIPGMPPDLLSLPEGCPFAPRCPLADDHCRTTKPLDRSIAENRTVECHKAEEVNRDELLYAG